jgi:putative transcription antitermination factor YqgF
MNQQRYLAIDYGSKRIGIAISSPGAPTDPASALAFPHSVIDISKGGGSIEQIVKQIQDICKENMVSAVIVGESKDNNGKDNKIMESAKNFVEVFKNKSGLPVYFHPEFMTSLQAAHIQGEGGMIDASAAAIILQSYMDLQKNNGR